MVERALRPAHRPQKLTAADFFEDLGPRAVVALSGAREPAFGVAPGVIDFARARGSGRVSLSRMIAAADLAWTRGLPSRHPIPPTIQRMLGRDLPKFSGAPSHPLR